MVGNLEKWYVYIYKYVKNWIYIYIYTYNIIYIYVYMKPGRGVQKHFVLFLKYEVLNTDFSWQRLNSIIFWKHWEQFFYLIIFVNGVARQSPWKKVWWIYILVHVDDILSWAECCAEKFGWTQTIRGVMEFQKSLKGCFCDIHPRGYKIHPDTKIGGLEMFGKMRLL